MKSNFGKWEDFLYPLKGRPPPRPPDIYDVTTIEPISCMSCDLANKLKQKVLKNYVKRNLFPTDKTTESPTSKLPRTSVQQKTEDVDDKGDAATKVDSVGRTKSQDDFVNLSISKKSWGSIDSQTSNASRMAGIIDLTNDLDEDGETETVTPPPLKKMHSYPLCLPSGMNLPHQGTPKPTMVSSSQSTANGTGKVMSTVRKENPRFCQTSPIKDRSTSLSKWTFNMFTEYIDFDEYVRELNFSAHTTGAEDVDLNVLFDDVLGMFGANNLKDCMLKENESRVLLDGILMKLSKKYKFRVQMEVKSKLQYLPTGTFDYMITTKNGVPLGCVEAKSPAAMEKKSFCQAVLELNLVQQLALKKGVDVENTPLFCILSDGYRFIFMQLKGTELFLEHTIQRPLGYVKSGAHTRSKVIQIRKLDGADDFKIMISSMTRLITSSLLSAEGPVVKKENELLMHFD